MWFPLIGAGLLALGAALIPGDKKSDRRPKGEDPCR